MVFCVVVVQIKFIRFGNDEWWRFRDGMHITVFIFFSWKWKFGKVRSCSFFRYICHHTNNISYMHNTFWHLHIWIFQTETFLVILRKRWTSSNILLLICIFFFIHTKKINRMMGFFPIFIKVFFFFNRRCFTKLRWNVNS